MARLRTEGATRSQALRELNFIDGQLIEARNEIEALKRQIRTINNLSDELALKMSKE